MKTYHLYEKFRNWENYSRILIYSDLHLVDENDEDSINTHQLFNYLDDDLQIENINKAVHKDDLLVILGDIGNPYKLTKLRCKNLILIKGNHDRGNELYAPYFKEIYDGPLFISDKLLLSHEPIHDREDNPRWINIHGHLHNMNEIDNECIHSNYICISANLHNYQPICLNDLFNHKGEFQDKDKCSLANIDSIHRQTIDRATKRKISRNQEVENDK